MDFTLRFTDEQTSFAAAIALDAVVNTDDGPLLARFTERYAIDVIGTVPGRSGWWVNLRIIDGSPLPDRLTGYVVTNQSPPRVWA